LSKVLVSWFFDLKAVRLSEVVFFIAYAEGIVFTTKEYSKLAKRTHRGFGIAILQLLSLELGTGSY
jgi:hypothetical protein